MNYIILLLCIILIGTISFFMFKKDFLSPTFISCVMYAICVLFAYVGLTSWNNERFIGIDIVLMIIMGILSFFLGEKIARLSEKDKPEENKKVELTGIKPNKWFIIGTVLVVILTTVLLFFEIKSVCNRYGFFSNSLPDLLYFFRSKSSVFNNDMMKDNIQINFFVKQLQKLCSVLCVFYMYITVRNILAKKNLKYIGIGILVILLCFGCTILTAGRKLMMQLVVAGLFMIIFLALKYKKISKKRLLMYFVIVALLSFAVFYFMLPLLGRKTDMNIIEYITFYLGVPIPSLNKVFDLVKNNHSYLGKNTFSFIYILLDKLHIIDYSPAGSYWVPYSVGRSNIYTSMKIYLQDFGYIGVIILQFAFGFIYSKVYLKIKRSNSYLFLIIYANYFYVLIDQIRGEEFYKLFSSTTVTYIILFVIVYYVCSLTCKLCPEKKKSNNKYIVIEGEHSDSVKFNAGSKARDDILYIVKNKNYKPLYINTKKGVQKKKILKPLQYLAYFMNTIIWDKELSKLSTGDTVLIQYPLVNTCFKLDYILRKYNEKINFILAVHDLDSIRYRFTNDRSKIFKKRVESEDKNYTKNSNYVISHNQKMTSEIIKFGNNPEKIINLNIFDYISSEKDMASISKDVRVIVAGNLNPNKCGYVKELSEIKDVKFNLYGPNYDDSNNSKNIDYKGVFKPDELIPNLEGKYGLVWDGDTVDGISGSYGKYLQFNNPHKTSLYLSSGLPVIVWDKSAIAIFVTENNLGLSVSSLKDLPKVLKNVSEKDYLKMSNNVKKISKKLKNGDFYSEALDKAEVMIQSQGR